MVDIKYFIENYSDSGEPPNISFYGTRKCILPDSVATAFDAYMKTNGMEILQKSEWFANSTTYGVTNAPVVDWSTWFDKPRLEKLLAFCNDYGHTAAAEEIKKVLGE